MSPIENDRFDDYSIDIYEEEDRDTDVELAKPEIEDIILQQKVVTDRELKVRLEHLFFPWVTGRALLAMEKEGMVRRMGYVGRKSRTKRVPESFFMSYGTEYDSAVGIIRKKRRVTKDINAILTAHAPAGEHAEDLFEEAFVSLGFRIHGTGMSEFKGRKVKRREGKEPPNLDFIIEKDKVIYGVDIKNWIKYEYNTRSEVRFKVGLALQLRVVPFIVARYVDKETLYLDVVKNGGICYRYKTLLVPPSYESLASEAVGVLGYPVLAVDMLPKYKVQWIEKLHKDFLEKRKSRKG